MALTTAVNILQDCACTLAPCGADDGDSTQTAGTAVSFKADEIEVAGQTDTFEHQTAMDAVKHFRSGSGQETITVRTKMNSTAIIALLRANMLAKIVVTAPTGYGFTFVGLIQSHNAKFGLPSTLEFTLVSYGTVGAFA